MDMAAYHAASHPCGYLLSRIHLKPEAGGGCEGAGGCSDSAGAVALTPGDVSDAAEGCAAGSVTLTPGDVSDAAEGCAAGSVALTSGQVLHLPPGSQ